MVENETLKTWIIRKDKEGYRYLTHKPEQWYDKALFNLIEKEDKLVFRFIWWKDKEPEEEIKGYYIGRITEMLLVRFSNYFGKFEII